MLSRWDIIATVILLLLGIPMFLTIVFYKIYDLPSVRRRTKLSDADMNRLKKFKWPFYIMFLGVWLTFGNFLPLDVKVHDSLTSLSLAALGFGMGWINIIQSDLAADDSELTNIELKEMKSSLANMSTELLEVKGQLKALLETIDKPKE